MGARRSKLYLTGNRQAQPSAPQLAAGSSLLYRSALINRAAINADSRTIDLTFSSDVELERWPGVIEILSHAPGAVDLTRLLNGAQLLFNHTPDHYIGVVESASVGINGRGHCTVRFSDNADADKIFRDVQSGILRNVSVGYQIKEIKLTEERESGLDIYTVSRWEPYEVSIVTIPADISVGIGRDVRSLFEKSPQKHTQNLNQIIMNRTQMLNALRARGITVDDSTTDEALGELMTRSLAPAVPATAVAVATPRASAIEVGLEHSRGATEERERVRSILAAGSNYKQTELAQAAVEAGHSIDEFRATLLESIDKRNHAIVDGTRPIGMSENEARSFSFIKLMRALSADGSEKKRHIEAAKFEFEACEAAAGQITHRALKGTAIPTDVLMTALGKRGDIVSVKTGAGYTGTAGATVPTTLLASSFIDLLRNKNVLLGLGSELGGLVGNIDIPKQTAGSTAYWLGEDDDQPIKEDIEFGLVQLNPKTVANLGEVTRKALMQTTLSMEALFRDDLARGLAKEIDRAGFYGLGTTNQPRGIKLVSGINTANWAAANAPTYAELVAMETAIAADNADVSSMCYVLNPTLRGYFKTTQRFAATDGSPIWEPGNTLNGYRTEVTNQIALGDVFLANFADLLIGMWGGLDITVDPYTFSSRGRIRYTCFQDVDFAHRRADSFCYNKNV